MNTTTEPRPAAAIGPSPSALLAGRSRAWWLGAAAVV
ncbi:MAG: hypothetical protein QOI45_1247, partial [Thermoleophilaceae bacterium]|nr:hypothetical protein [Thermoleophilaceae bacterium]